MRLLRNSGRSCSGARLALALLAGALVGLTARPADAEVFFPEIQVLSATSFLAVTMSERTNDSRSAAPGSEVRSTQESANDRIQANLRLGPAGLGGLAARQRLKVQTDSFQVKDNQDTGTVYLAAGARDLLVGDDRLVLLLSQGSSSDEYHFDDLVLGLGSYHREVDADSLVRAGLLYRFSAVLVGYAQGRVRTRLAIDDPGRAPIREKYDYGSQVAIAGLVFQGQDSVARLIWERMDTPSKSGTVVDLKPGSATHVQLTLGLGAFGFSADRTRLKLAYHNPGLNLDEASRDATETIVSLGFRVSDAFTLSASQSRRESEVGLYLLGVPIVNRTDSQATLVTLRWQF